MCTAISFYTKDHYFGRNLDLEYSYNETITITPRNYPLHFRYKDALKKHYAIIGMAYIQDSYPLYYEATNEKGLSMAALYFPENAEYKPYISGKNNVAPFEFIPWVLAQCESVKAAHELLSNLNLVQEDYSSELPSTPLHWIISDQVESLTVESVKTGLRIYANHLNALTNNPPFDQQLAHWNEFYVRYCPTEVPGDLASESRFIRVVNTKRNSICGSSEIESVNQFFHFLSSVEYTKGLSKVTEDRYRTTIYSSCCNMDKGIYYYKTYNNSQISAVNMHHENLEAAQLISYPLLTEAKINWQN